MNTTARTTTRGRSPAAAPASVPAQILKAIVLIVACALVVMPFVSVVSTSLADQQQITDTGGYVLFPDNPSLSAYHAILAGGVVARALLVSVGIAVVGTLLGLTATSAMAYSLSRPGSFAHKPILMTVLLTMLFSPGIIPNYLLIKQLGLLNSWWSLILPVMVTGFSVIVLRSFMMGLPQDILESARIDGANDLQIFVRIILPLSKAAMAVIGLFFAVGFWNSWFNALLYINDPSKLPLPLVLRTYVVDNARLGAEQLSAETGALPPAQSLQMAILVISLVPILLVYPFLQRHFTKGVLVGAVKG
ncbi:carbohydrate ABC transporter permease [Kribbella sp. CA-247076]|uniref:carbohydrate ABC transporter permease n=1 Tax=Kribbella sp. CA-247076 TaxID=3239941 RepID=UPI003D8A9109